MNSYKCKMVVGIDNGPGEKPRWEDVRETDWFWVDAKSRDKALEFMEFYRLPKFIKDGEVVQRLSAVRKSPAAMLEANGYPPVPVG